MGTRLLLLSFLGLMFGLLFFDMDTSDVAGMGSMNGFLFVGPTFCAVLFMLTSVPSGARLQHVLVVRLLDGAVGGGDTVLHRVHDDPCIDHILDGWTEGRLGRVLALYACGCHPQHQLLEHWAIAGGGGAQQGHRSDVDGNGHLAVQLAWRIFLAATVNGCWSQVAVLDQPIVLQLPRGCRHSVPLRRCGLSHGADCVVAGRCCANGIGLHGAATGVCVRRSLADDDWCSLLHRWHAFFDGSGASIYQPLEAVAL